MFLACLSLNLVYLCSLAIIPCVGQEQFYITRTTVGSQKDLFIIPKCSSSSLTCSALYTGALNHDPTQCKCACRYEYSTFGYYNGRWVCLDNSKVRKQPGCQFLFDGEGNHQPLKVLSSGSSRQVIFPSISCTIDQSASLYRKCDGTWAAVSTQSTMFSFWPHTENLGRGRYRYTMKVGTASSLAGRLVRLKVNCKNPSRSSCVLLKIAGQITCPVNIVRSSTTQVPTATVNVTYPPTTQLYSSKTPTRNNSTEVPGPAEGSSNSGQSGGSSGTVAAIVIIIILVIIVAAIVGFVIWKRRGENILLVDHILSIATKFRSPPSTKKPEEPPEERIYAEIPEQPAPRQTANKPCASHYAEIYSVAYQDPNSIHATPKQQNNTASPKIPDEAATDERGYMVPVDSPLHNSVHDNNHPNTASDRNKNPITYDKRRDPSRCSTHENGVENNYAVPYYDILEESDKQYRKNIDKTSVYNRQLNSPSSVGAGNSDAWPSAGPGTEGAEDGKRCVYKQRRRPPSPPRKI